MKRVFRAYAATLVLAMTVALSTPSQASLFKIGERSELKMGREAADEIEHRYSVSRDPKLNSMIQDIGLRLARASERPNLPWQFKVLELDDVNALSVPGYVYVNRGVIDLAKGDTDQLAGVIAHEIGHTAGRHAVRQAEKEMQYSLILGFVLKGGVAQLGNIAANLAMLGYSRKDEYDADKRGVHYMSQAGYDPEGMVRFFQALQVKDPDHASRFSTYFRTHPATPNRIVRVQQEIGKLPVNSGQ